MPEPTCGSRRFLGVSGGGFCRFGTGEGTEPTRTDLRASAGDLARGGGHRAFRGLGGHAARRLAWWPASAAGTRPRLGMAGGGRILPAVCIGVMP